MKKNAKTFFDVLKQTAMAAALLYSASSCHSIKEVPIQTIIEHHTLLRDTVVKHILEAYSDSVSIKDTSSYLANPYAESHATWKRGRLNHSLRTFPNEIAIKLSLPQTTVKTSTDVPILIEKPLSRLEAFKLKLGGAMLWLLPLSLVLGLLWHNRKRLNDN